jgi:Bacterial membrane protein YfhO
LKRSWPILLLAAEVLAFFRHILFYGHYTIPWDFRYYHFSQSWFIARSLARGELPLWDPYTYCGMPFYANLTAQVFYPPTLAAILLSNWTGGEHLLYWLQLQLAAHVFLAGAFTYWLLRRLGVERVAAIIGATVYQLGAYTASQAEHLGAIDAAAWLPLAWLCVIALGEQFRWRWLAGLAPALALSILAGFPAATVVVFVTSMLLGAILVALRRASSRVLVYTAVAAVWAVLLAAIQLFPTLQLSRLSVAQYRSHYLQTGGGMPFAALVSLVLPNHYGVFQFDGGTWKLPYEVTFLYTYCGIPALLFAALALIFRRNRYTVSIGLLTLCTLLWMLGDSTPVGATIFRLVPDAAKNSLYAQFALCGFSLGMAVLAGLGAQQFLSGRTRWIQAAMVAIVAVDLIAVSSGRPFNTVDENRDPGIGYDHYASVPQVPGQLRRLANQTVPPWRMDAMQGYADMITHGPLFEYPSANGNDPFALVRLMQVRLSFCKGVLWGRYYEIDDPDSPVLKLLNVRYVLASHTLDKPGGLVKALELPGTFVYENPGALSRFFLVSRVHRAANMDAALMRLRARDFDPRTEAVVEAPVEMEGNAPSGDVHVREYSARGFTVETDASVPAFLVTSETAYPGWNAWVDGEARTPVMTNAAFRGLPVPAGRHVVKMRFDPPILSRSAWVTLAASVMLALAVWFGDNRQQKGPWTLKSS